MVSYEVDDVVLYSTNGPCRVHEILLKNTERYYELVPVFKTRTKLLVPCDNDELVGRMRPLPTRKEVDETIRRAMAEEPREWIADSDSRRVMAKNVLKDGDELEIMRLIKSFYMHNKLVEERDRKHPLSSDIAILKNARMRLHEEFAVVLEIEPDEVQGHLDALAAASACAPL